MHWVKLTDPNNQPILVNLERAASIRAWSGSLTQIAFLESELATTYVKETLEEILSILETAP